MYKVTFAFEDGNVVETFANTGDNLLEIAREANVAIDAPCSGNASCGKCRVQLKSGELDSKKTLHISEEEYQEGWLSLIHICSFPDRKRTSSAWPGANDVKNRFAENVQMIASANNTAAIIHQFIRGIYSPDKRCVFAYFSM